MPEETIPFYKRFAIPAPGEPQGFILKFWDSKGNCWPYDCPGQKRQQWELDAGKNPVFCDKYAMQRVRKILSQNIARVKTAVVVQKATNEIVIRYIYKNGYLKTTEILPLQFYRMSKYNLSYISYTKKQSEFFTNDTDQIVNTK